MINPMFAANVLIKVFFNKSRFVRSLLNNSDVFFNKKAIFVALLNYLPYNFNNKFWYKYVYSIGHGLAFSPFFNEEDIIEISGEKYINEEIIIRWNLFSLAELGGLN